MPALNFLIFCREISSYLSMPHTPAEVPLFHRPKTLRLCWGLDGSATDGPPIAVGVLFLASSANTPFCMQYLALLGRNWMHRIPWEWEPVTFSLFRISHRNTCLTGVADQRQPKPPSRA